MRQQQPLGDTVKNYQTVARELMVVQRAWWNPRGLFGIRNGLSVGIVIALALMLSAAARAATITVNSLADTGAAGICVLRDAITAANTMAATNGCAAGTGNDTIQFSVTGTIALVSTLPPVTANILTINGPASPGITIDGGHAVQVMEVALGAILNLNDLTIANGATSSGYGGGVSNAGTLTVTHSTFSGNSSITSPRCGFQIFGGGGVFNVGTMTVSNSIFSGNSVSGCQVNGAGIWNSGGTLSITNSTFSGNNGFGASGGGVSNDGTMTVTNSTFSANSAGIGGGISNGGRVTVANSTFSGNDASAGGGIYHGGLAMTVINCTFSGNSATSGGGGIHNQGPGTVTNSTFSGNNAISSGGGIENYWQLQVTNSTVSGNNASSGGGIYNFAGQRPASHVSLKGLLLAANGAGGNCSNSAPAILTDGGYNIADDSTCRFSATGSHNSTDPQLDPAGLGNNGGPTQTIALQSTSPAIDAIPLANCTDQSSPPNPVITDQRGFPRPDDAETACDIGAYEVQDTSFIPFSRFGGGLTIDPDAGVFYLSGGFILGAGGSIDPLTEQVTFSVGNYSVTLPPGSFVKVKTGYVYQKKVNNIFLCVYIKFTSASSTYQLLANRIGGTLSTASSPVPVTLTIGDNSGSTQMNARFN